MNILFIAPIPPPINGQSLASFEFYKYLSHNHNVILINFRKPPTNFYFSFFPRFFFILKIFLKVILSRNKVDVVYLTISESLFGNIKDILTYFLLIGKWSKLVVHLHGGAGLDKLLRFRLLSFINIYFLSKFKSVILLGSVQKRIFLNHYNCHNVDLVPNFSLDELFISSEKMDFKYSSVNKIKVLFLSNLITGKGYLELINGFLSLEDKYKSNFELNFAGGFADNVSKSKFFKLIEGHNNIVYHGIVSGKYKRNLFFDNHIFCLPTYYPFEGQPISILEAYASGCFVITTNHSGIPDIFSNNVNGILVEAKSPESINKALIYCVENFSLIESIGRTNNFYAIQKFSLNTYNSSLYNLVSL